MKVKKSLENRIRGWLPKEPALPTPKIKAPIGKQMQNQPKPDLTSIAERKFQLTNGVVIGLGTGLILIGFLGWLSTSSTYETLWNFFAANGLDPASYYLFGRLTDTMAIYLSLTVMGAGALLLGFLALKSFRVKQFLFPSNRPHAHLGGGLIGGGGALTFSAHRSFFVYLLTGDFFELRLFAVFFLFGALLITFGMVAMRQKS